MTSDGPQPEPGTGPPPGGSLIDLLAAHTAPAPDGAGGAPSPEDLLEEFASWAAENGLTLYPAQEDALLELASGSHVILSTPTGSGKSLVAIGAMFFALAQGRRTYYTAPIKALVSEKFFDLCDLLGPERVGMITGDAAVNPEAPVICATAEILANLALRQGSAVDVGVVCMDEFHYYGDRDRGWAWQIPLIELTGAQFLLMSATLGDMRRIRDDLTRRTGQPAAIVAGGERPVPLTYSYALTPIHETIEALLEADRAPIYVVHPTQALALERAQALMSLNVCTRAEKDAIADAIGDFRFTAGFGRTLTRLVRHGIGVHHAGMLPRYRRLVEQLTRSGPAQGGVRHGHPGRGDQRPDPHRPDHLPVQVRRAAHAAAAGPRVPPDRRAGRACRVRHRRHGRRPGPGARDREPAAGRQGRRRPEEAAQDRAQEAAGRGADVEPGDVRPPRGGRARAAAIPVRRDPRDAAQRRPPPRRCVGGPDPPADRQRRGARRARGPRRACRGHARVAAGGRRPGGDRPAGRRRPDGAHRRRAAGRLRPQPAAVDVRPGGDRAARPGVGDLRARRALGAGVHPRGSAAGAVRPAVPGAR